MNKEEIEILNYEDYMSLINHYFKIETFEKAKEYCVRDLLNLQNRYVNEHELRKQLLFQVNQLKEVDKQICNEELINEKYVRENFINKDIIRDKIKEIEENVKDFEEYWKKDPRKLKKEVCVDYYKLEVLKELLGE